MFYERITSAETVKHCGKCNTKKSATEFYKSKNSNDGLQARCKECDNAARAEWRRENLDRELAKSNRWKEKNPDRVAATQGKAGAKLRGAIVSDIYDHEEAVAFYAEARRLSRDTGVKYEVDHIIPVAQGGLHCHTNLQVITRAENLAKGCDTDLEAPPAWTTCDRQVDITDIWLEETDPENERGESATAYLKANKHDDGMEVAGIAIEEPEGDKTYRAREAASRLIGWAGIYRIEEYEMQAPGYGSDDERDIQAEWAS